MKKNPLILLTERGQSVWLDNLTRPLIQGGQLARLIREDGLSGVTSNPAIFKKAMTAGDGYDRQIRELARAGKTGLAVYEALAIEDIRGAFALIAARERELRGDTADPDLPVFADRGPTARIVDFDGSRDEREKSEKE